MIAKKKRPRRRKGKARAKARRTRMRKRRKRRKMTTSRAVKKVKTLKGLRWVCFRQWREGEHRAHSSI
jgi:hypothetical protein